MSRAHSQQVRAAPADPCLPSSLYINRLLADPRVEHIDMADAYARLNSFEEYAD